MVEGTPGVSLEWWSVPESVQLKTGAVFSYKHEPPHFGQALVPVGVPLQVKVWRLHREVGGRSCPTALWVVHLHGLHAVHLARYI